MEIIRIFVTINYNVMKKALIFCLFLLSSMLCLNVRAQKVSVEEGDMIPYGKEFQGTTWWTILHYEDDNILAYSMIKGGKLALIRFDNRFNVKQKVVSSVPWYLADLDYYDGKIKGVFYDRKLTYCCFDAGTLKLTKKKELFLPEGWAADHATATGTVVGSVRRVVEWSPDHKYVGVGVFVRSDQFGLHQKAWRCSHLYLYDEDFNQIATTVADYEKFPISGKNPKTVSFYPDIEVFNNGEMLYRVKGWDKFHILSKDGFKEYKRFDDNMKILEYKDDKFIYMCDRIKEYDKNAQTARIISIQPDGVRLKTNLIYKYNKDNGDEAYIVSCDINGSQNGIAWMDKDYKIGEFIGTKLGSIRDPIFGDISYVSGKTDCYQELVYVRPEIKQSDYAITQCWVESIGKDGVFKRSEVKDLNPTKVGSWSSERINSSEWLFWQQNITNNKKNPMQRWVRLKIEE